MKTGKALICFTIAAALLSLSLFEVPRASAAGDSWPVMVSLGDSYSSGEGIEPFYSQDWNQKQCSTDWVAHRSQKSWPGRLTLPLPNGTRITMSDHRDESWYFVASSGAETCHLSEPRYMFWSDNILSSGTTKLTPQLNVFDQLRAEGKTADFVTMTLGGNDVGFGDIITEAASTFTYTSFLMPSHLSDMLENTWREFYQDDGTREHIRAAYYAVAEKAGPQANIIVAGYPKLLSVNGNDLLFDAKEASLINDSVHEFNLELESLVRDCSSRYQGSDPINISFVSVEEAFAGHEAYSADPYINSVIFGSQAQELTWNAIASSYSMHPNDKGAQAYAECVQAKIDELLMQSSGTAAPEPTQAVLSSFDPTGTWQTSDGTVLIFDRSGDFSMQWGFGFTESGRYTVAPAAGNAYPIELEGGSILQLMALLYGGVSSSYHFELLVTDHDHFSLVQVYGDYTAATSPCTLPFTRTS